MISSLLPCEMNFLKVYSEHEILLHDLTLPLLSFVIMTLDHK
jgi:hypothetical protein